MKNLKSKQAVDLPPDVERYVQEGLDSGMDEGKAWAIAWSRWCKYKSPGDSHCSQGPGGYFQGRAAMEFTTKNEMESYLKEHPGADRANHSVAKNTKPKVEYPEYNRNITQKTMGRNEKVKEALGVISKLRDKIESTSGSPSLEKKIQGLHKTIVEHSEDALKDAKKILTSYENRTLSPQAELRVKTLKEVCSELENGLKKSGQPSGSKAQYENASHLQALTHNVSSTLVNLNERSTKKSSFERVALRFFEAANGISLLAQEKREVNRNLIRAGMDGNKRFESLGQALISIGVVLTGASLEISSPVESYRAKQPTGRMNLELSKSNEEDPYSPTAIRNTNLSIHWTALETGLEVVAYLG